MPGQTAAQKAAAKKAEEEAAAAAAAANAGAGTDVGVEMLPGSGSEPQGPEDALGEGPKRGDYTDRLGGDGYLPHEGLEDQRPRAEDIGDARGEKGGVDTAPAADPADDDPKKRGRTEEYDATKPNGKKVRVKHWIDTGHTEVIGEAD